MSPKSLVPGSSNGQRARPAPEAGRAKSALGGSAFWLAALVAIGAGAAGSAEAVSQGAASNGIVIPIDERAARAAGINTIHPDLDFLGQDLVFTGAVVVPPHQSSVVASPAAGMVESILVAQDEQVSAGQVIARLRSPQVVEAQHLYLAALTDEKLANDRLRRADALFKVKAMSEVQLVLAQGEAAHGQARVDERLQILQLMGVSTADIERLRTTRQISNVVDIQAPKAGTIIARNVNQGTRVDAAAPLFTVATLSPLWVVCHEHRGSTPGCATQREMKEGPSGSAIRS